MIDAEFEFRGLALTTTTEDMFRSFLSTTTSTTWRTRLKTSQIPHSIRKQRKRILPSFCAGFQASSLSTASQLNPSVDREEDEDFGEYDIILPPDEPVWGVDHIIPRVVPSGIVRPPYAALNRPGPLDSSHDERARSGDGRIDIRGEAVGKLRRAGALAKEVLRNVEGLVKVILTGFIFRNHVSTFNLYSSQVSLQMRLTNISTNSSYRRGRILPHYITQTFPGPAVQALII